jgi:hypothetical protein
VSASAYAALHRRHILEILISLPEGVTDEDKRALDARFLALGVADPVDYDDLIRKSFGLETVVLYATFKVLDKLTDKALTKAWSQIKVVARELAAQEFKGGKAQVGVHIEGSDRGIRLETGGEEGVRYLDNARAVIAVTDGSVELFYDEDSHQYLTAE